MKQIVWNMLGFLVLMFSAILLVGIYSMMKVEYMYPISDDLMNGSPNETYQEYLALKEDFLMSDDPFIILLNYISFIGLMWLFVDSARTGWNSRLYSLKDTMIKYSVVFILVFYILTIVMNYLINIFVEQILVVLFNDILNQIYAFQLFYNFFIGIFLICVLISFISNQIRYYKAIDV